MTGRVQKSRVGPVSAAPNEHAPPATPDYWDDVAGEWQDRGSERAWRMVSDAVNIRMLQRWLTPQRGGSVLKTDLFDEVAGGGLVPWLSSSFGCVAGIDISPVVVETAQAHFPRLRAELADVRALPFPDETFDAVVSNSTLDHFTSRDDIAIAVRELHRVTRSGGSVVVTLDNPVNPVLAIRNALPARLQIASGMVAFSVGVTCGPHRLRALLESTGFEVMNMSAEFHCPRVLVVLGGQLIDRYAGTTAKRRYVRLCAAFERLSLLPTRFLTGYFVSALARKR